MYMYLDKYIGKYQMHLYVWTPVYANINQLNIFTYVYLFACICPDVCLYVCVHVYAFVSVCLRALMFVYICLYPAICFKYETCTSPWLPILTTLCIVNLLNALSV